jgi:hypothetical protein
MIWGRFPGRMQMKLKKATCFAKMDKIKAEEDYSIYFIPSGFNGLWIKVWECYDYTIGAEYASEGENGILNKKSESKLKWVRTATPARAVSSKKKGIE